MNRYHYIRAVQVNANKFIRCANRWMLFIFKRSIIIKRFILITCINTSVFYYYYSTTKCFKLCWSIYKISHKQHNTVYTNLILHYWTQKSNCLYYASFHVSCPVVYMYIQLQTRLKCIVKTLFIYIKGKIYYYVNYPDYISMVVLLLYMYCTWVIIVFYQYQHIPETTN